MTLHYLNLKGYLLNDDPIDEDPRKRFSWQFPPKHDINYRIYGAPIENNYDIEKVSGLKGDRNYDELTYVLSEEKWKKVNNLGKGKVEFLEAGEKSALSSKLGELKQLTYEVSQAWRSGIREFFNSVDKSDLDKMEAHEYFGLHKNPNNPNIKESPCKFLNDTLYSYLFFTGLDLDPKIDSLHLEEAKDQGRDAAELVWKAYLESKSENPWWSLNELDYVPNPAYADYIHWVADFPKSKNKEYLNWRLKNTDELTELQYELVEFSSVDVYGREWHYMNNNGALIAAGFEFALDDKDEIIANRNEFEKLEKIDKDSPKSITVFHDSYKMQVEQQKSTGEKNDIL